MMTLVHSITNVILQLPMVVEHEVPQFHEAFKNVGNNYKWDRHI